MAATWMPSLRWDSSLPIAIIPEPCLDGAGLYACGSCFDLRQPYLHVTDYITALSCTARILTTRKSCDLLHYLLIT